LRIISYNMELANIAENKSQNNNFETIMEHYKDCKNGKFCLTALKKLVVLRKRILLLLIY